MNISSENNHFIAFKDLSIMHGRAFVMLILEFNDISHVMRKPAFGFLHLQKQSRVTTRLNLKRTPIVNPLCLLNQSLLAISIVYTARIVSDLVEIPMARFFVSWLKLYALKSKRGTQSAFVDTSTILDSLTPDMSFRT